MTLEELIGGEVTDVLEGSWIEVTLQDGRVATIVSEPNFVGLTIQDWRDDPTLKADVNQSQS